MVTQAALRTKPRFSRRTLAQFGFFLSLKCREQGQRKKWSCGDPQGSLGRACPRGSLSVKFPSVNMSWVSGCGN